jgi:antitoxin ParD1/3/4
MSMTSMNVSLPAELKEYAEQQTKHGYSTPSEYVRELIREDQKRRAKEKLDALLLEGLDSGAGVPMDKKFWSCWSNLSTLASKPVLTLRNNISTLLAKHAPSCRNSHTWAPYTNPPSVGLQDCAGFASKGLRITSFSTFRFEAG